MAHNGKDIMGVFGWRIRKGDWTIYSNFFVVSYLVVSGVLEFSYPMPHKLISIL